LYEPAPSISAHPAWRQKTIWLNIRETARLAYSKSKGNALHIQLAPGADTPVQGAIARVILENGWEDSEWIKKWVNNKLESNSGFGQGARNTSWQWRTPGVNSKPRVSRSRRSGISS
jgi:arsenite oxidase large subunit